MSSYLTAICAGPYAQWHTEYENEDGRVVPMGQYWPPVAGRGLRQGRRLPVRRHQEGLRVLRQDLGHPVPVRQVRPDLRAGVQRGRDGEHRPGHDPRPVRVRLQGDRRALRTPRGDCAARAGPHVVRRLRDDEVVERPVAERILRRVHLHARHRRGHRLARRLGHVLLRREELGSQPGPAADHAPDRRPDQRPERYVRELRTASPTPRAPPCSSSSSRMWAASASSTASTAT